MSESIERLTVMVKKLLTTNEKLTDSLNETTLALAIMTRERDDYYRLCRLNHILPQS